MRFRSTAAACTLALALAACNETTDPGLPTSEVRLLNGGTAAPALDLMVGGQIVAQGIGADHASPFVDAPSGTQTLAIRASGTTTVLGSLSTTLVAGSRYTVMTIGTGSTLTPSVVADTGLARSDRANIRIINLVENPPAAPDSSTPPLLLDVYITAPGASLDGATPRLSMNGNWPSYSTLLYYDPGSWAVRFTTGGTKTVIAETGSIAIGAGQVRAVKLSRTPSGGWTTAVVEEP